MFAARISVGCIKSAPIYHFHLRTKVSVGVREIRKKCKGFNFFLERFNPVIEFPITNLLYRVRQYVKKKW